MRASRPISTGDISRVTTQIRNVRLPQITADAARNAITGVTTPYRVYVDGREGAPLNSVRPGGLIRFVLNPVGRVIDWLYSQLIPASPIGKMEPPHLHYFQDHELYINDGRYDVGSGEFGPIEVPNGATARIVNGRPYAAAIEHGLSVQAPDGVYEIVAFMAQRMFPGVAIVFEYVDLPGRPYRYPSIAVSQGN